MATNKYYKVNKKATSPKWEKAYFVDCKKPSFTAHTIINGNYKTLTGTSCRACLHPHLAYAVTIK